MPFSDDADKIAVELHNRLLPKHMIGCSAESVIGTGREIEMQSAISLWAGHLPQTNVSGMWLQVEQSADGMAVTGWEEGLHEGWPENSTLLMLALECVAREYSLRRRRRSLRVMLAWREQHWSRSRVAEGRLIGKSLAI